MADVIVVGGGIIGAACALELAERGAAVTLIEREHLAAGASGRNLGLLVMPDDEALVPMYRASVAAYLAVSEAAAFDIFMDREPCGLIQVALDGNDIEPATKHAGFLASHGVTVRLLESANEIREIEPALARDLPGVWHVAEGRRVDPGALTVALASTAAIRGAVVRHHLQVRALHVVGERVRGVITDDGVLPSDAVVIAAGPWSPSLLEPAGVRFPLWPVRGWLLRVAPSRPGLLRHIVERVGWTGTGELNRPPVTSELEGARSDQIGAALHPGVDGTITCGSSWEHAVTPEPRDSSIPARIAAMCARVVPSLASAEVRGSWWGLRPVTSDDRPIVDRVMEGLHVATGHGALGVILGAGTAQLLAADVLGMDAPFDPAPFRAHRFLA